MNLYFISIFPDIFKSFLETSLFAKAIEKGIVRFEIVNPRDFCTDKHKQIDDEIYGGGKGMLIKAKPMIDAVNKVAKKCNGSIKILYLSPSKNIFDQEKAFEYSKIDNLILIGGRYEGIDHRFELYLQDNYDSFEKISIGRFVSMGGELPMMLLAETVCRLVPGVIKESESFQIESYSPEHNLTNIEYPQYTRPQEVLGYKVPAVLMNGNHKEIKNWNDNHTNFL